MNNWDARDEGGKHCTLDQDLKSIDKSCKILGISRLYHLNYQSSYWQRVFSPVLEGYQSGTNTPNPDILCNREIKFGELFQWAVEEKCADYLATGHYARIHENDQLRQACDLGKDQTYFLAAIDRNCLKRTMFPVGNLMKSTVKTELVREAGLKHLLDRKESMGLCFIGKRGRRFQEFLSNFVRKLPEPGQIIDLESGNPFEQQHSGLSNYTLGQNVSISGAKSRLYVAAKDPEKNRLLVVDNLKHPALWSNSLRVSSFEGWQGLSSEKVNVYCVIRSVDKRGVRVKRVSVRSGSIEVELENPVFAPCPGQWAVFYAEDENSDVFGRICLGGSQIVADD